jgi:hypothetical protein
MDGRRRGGSRLFAMDGASAGQRRALKPSVTTSACLRETARLKPRPRPLWWETAFALRTSSFRNNAH